MGGGGRWQETGFYSGLLKSRALILNIQGSPKDPRAGRLADLMGAGSRVRKSHPNQSRYFPIFFPGVTRSLSPSLCGSFFILLSTGPFLPMALNWLPNMAPSSLCDLPSLVTMVCFSLFHVLRRVKDLTGPSWVRCPCLVQSSVTRRAGSCNVKAM